jgi:drug/metabolite transporter (DMT)-like permease
VVACICGRGDDIECMPGILVMSFVIVLALCSAVAYGLSDFVGGVLARRTSAWAVATMSQGVATVLTAALVTTNVGEFSGGTLWWGILAGIGSAAGNVFIYGALAAGRMVVVAPLSAIVAAALPVLVGTATGERPGILPMAGVLAALPAIWLVSGGRGLQNAGRVDIVKGLAAGAGFGVQFSALGQVSHDAGLMPLAMSQATSVVAIVLGAVVLSAEWTPRDQWSRLGAVAGLLAGIATVCFQLAVQHGLLTIGAVLASLYPAVTVLLAAVLLRERVQRAQGVGLTLAAAAVALIALG